MTLGATALAEPSGTLPAPGEWDGVTAKASLDRPYEDARQATIRFGLISYFAHPWRSYMDTWPASHFLPSMGFVFNVGSQYSDAVCQLMAESGIRTVRYEVGWGNFNWTNQLTGGKREETIATLQTFKRHGLRPLILLNSHHAAPCPYRNVWVDLVADARKGDRVLKVKDASGIRTGYTGPMNGAEYCAAKPLITSVDADGTCHLSMPLGEDFKAGRLSLHELKYQPLQGAKRKDGTPVPEAQAVVEGWKEYVRSTAEMVVEALGTAGQPDAGFDIEVWNELTFGSNFLNINNYYEQKPEYSEPLAYRKTRTLAPGLRPDAKTEYKTEHFGVLFAVTVDFFRANDAAYPGVKVDNGFDNQWPWDSGTDSWPGQDSISRHYYLGSWRDISPTNNSRADLDTINAFGERDGKRPATPKDWYDIIPGSNFIPTFRAGLPEWGYCGFQTESIVRDVMPDSRITGMPGHGRYTHNGDFHTVELWQTEFNYGRQAFFDRLFQETGAPRDDARAYALDNHITGKMLLRMYLFQNHKGLKRLYVFAPGDPPYGINMLTPPSYAALDKSGGKLTPEVRATVPAAYQGLGWLTRQMETGAALAAPRPLRVDDLVEYKPRLMFAGDGSPARPHQWNRDWFAFMPYQLSANRFIVPYFVVTVDANHIWDAKRDPFDPARYDMPAQEFDVTIGNCAGQGATVSAFDPLSNTEVPVKVVASTRDTLTVRLPTVDYPRVLLITEAKPGPQILNPKVAADKAGNVTVKWQTNVKVESVKVTYGHDWPNRGANVVQLKPSRSDYAVTLPTGLSGVVAVRIAVTAGGLTTVWPRWDEDPLGQVVVPGSVAGPAAQPASAQPATLTNAVTVPVPLTAPEGISLPVVESNPGRGYSVNLPKGVVLAGPADDRDGQLGEGNKAVTLRLRHVVGGAKSPQEALPFVAVGDQERRQAVTLPDGTVATMVEFQFLAEAHPGMDNLWQRHLLVPAGKDGADLLVVSATGNQAAMVSQEKGIRAIFASINLSVTRHSRKQDNPGILTTDYTDDTDK
jgi:hypothetical protein